MLDGIKVNISLCIALLSIICNLVWIILGILHYKKGHRVPDAKKIENKKKKQELKAAYKASLKCLKETEDEKKK